MSELRKSFEWGEMPKCVEATHELPDSVKVAAASGEKVTGSVRCKNCKTTIILG